MNDLTVNIVAINVIKDGCVALSIRKGDKNPGYWQDVGGKVEPGEKHLDAAVRELLEETGLVVITSRLKETCRNEYISCCGKSYKVTCFNLFLCSGGEVLKNTEPEKNGSWEFFDPVWALKHLNLLDGVRFGLSNLVDSGVLTQYSI